MLTGLDDKGRTVIAMAASSGKSSNFDTVLKTVKDELDPTEVRQLICLSSLRALYQLVGNITFANYVKIVAPLTCCIVKGNDECKGSLWTHSASFRGLEQH